MCSVGLSNTINTLTINKFINYLIISLPAHRWERFLKVEKTTGDGSQQSMNRYAKIGSSYPANHPLQKALTKPTALNLVIDCDLPVSIVEKPGFLRHHETIDKSYSAVNRYV